MLVRFGIRLVVLAVIIGLVNAIVPGIHTHGGVGWLIWIAFIFALVNLILGPVFLLFSIPLIIVTFGVFLLVVNAALLGITAALTDHLDVDGFWNAVLGGLLITVFSVIAQRAFKPKRRPGHRTEIFVQRG